MEITEVRVFPVDEDKLKAFASIVIDDAFVVSDIKIIDGKKGRFLSMPSTKRRNGTFRDIAHPLNNETRRLIESKIFGRYDEILASGERPCSHGAMLAELEEHDDDEAATHVARERQPLPPRTHAAL
jgi:stage V sporulation protein G